MNVPRFFNLKDEQTRNRRNTPASVRKNPNPEPALPISQRARDVADNLELTDNEIMLDFLSGAEELLLADGHGSQTVIKSMLRARREYGALIVKEFMRCRVQ